MGKQIVSIEYDGSDDRAEFIRFFHARLLAELKKRSFLTCRQYEKGLKLLEAGK